MICQVVVMWKWRMEVVRMEGLWCTKSRFATTIVREIVKMAGTAGMNIGANPRLGTGGQSTDMWISKEMRKANCLEME
jgi:hypothetical protein